MHTACQEFPARKQSRKKDKKTSSSSSSSAAPIDTQDDLMVYISRRAILQAVGSAIKQDVQGYLHCSYLDDTIQASVHMGAVQHPGTINENPMIFKGEPAATQDEAEEGATQAALNYHQRLQLLYAAGDKGKVIINSRKKYVQSSGSLTWLGGKYWRAYAMTSDVVPLRMHPHHPFTEDRIISYTDSCPPMGRLKHFAKALYHFIIDPNPARDYTRMI
ncbi:hypothetical protein ACQJBY_053514 [Aegilops geniculata]